MKRTCKDRIQDLNDIIDIQGSDGNWNVDQYMLGLYNGLEMVLAIMENRGANFRSLEKVNIFKRIYNWFLLKKTGKYTEVSE